MTYLRSGFVAAVLSIGVAVVLIALRIDIAIAVGISLILWVFAASIIME
jgi:hypothetical protein